MCLRARTQGMLALVHNREGLCVFALRDKGEVGDPQGAPAHLDLMPFGALQRPLLRLIEVVGSWT